MVEGAFVMPILPLHSASNLQKPFLKTAPSSHQLWCTTCMLCVFMLLHVGDLTNLLEDDFVLHEL